MASGHVRALEADVRRAAARAGQREHVGERDAASSVAVPVAPGPHGASPGMSRIAISPARRLPAHCSVAVTSRSRNASRNVASERSAALDQPVDAQAPRPGSISGTAPWPRT